MEPMAGIEPATDGLRNRCSTTELHWLPCNSVNYRLENSRGKDFLGFAQAAAGAAAAEAVLDAAKSTLRWRRLLKNS